MSYQFQSILHPTQSQMHDAIAFAEMTANGNNGKSQVKQFFEESTVEELAADCIAGWGLEDHEHGLEHFDRQMLIASLTDMRDNLDDWMD